MPKLIVKPTINFLSTDTDAALVAHVEAILAGLTDNADYPNPVPSLDSVAAAQAAFVTAFSEAALGGVVLTATKHARRVELVSLVRQLASYVAVACKGDLAILLSSNFPSHKPTREAIGQLDAPQTPRLAHGVLSGTMYATTKSVRGAFIYNWRLALASEPETILINTQSTGARTEFRNLTPGLVYCVSVNAVGAAGPSDYSGVATLMSL